MQFAKHLREGVRRGRIRCSVRIWITPRVKVGGRYRMDDGHIVVEAIDRIRRADITPNLARESGFSSVKDLLETAQHGRGDNVYLVRFRYLPPGAWDGPPATGAEPSDAESPSREQSELLQRIRSSKPPPPAVQPRSRR